MIKVENKENRRGNRVEMLDKDSKEREELIDKSAYGEFIPTFHRWISFEEQKERTDKIYESIDEERV